MSAFDDFRRAIDAAENALWPGSISPDARKQSRAINIERAKKLARDFPEFPDWYREKFPKQKYRLEVLDQL